MNKVLIAIFSLFVVVTHAQKIKIKVNGEKDTTVFLVKYYGKGMYYADTAVMKNGNVEFDGTKQKPGVLALLLSGNKYFDFIYNNEEVQLETSSPDFIKSMLVKKSNENTIFLKYIAFMNEKRGQSKVMGEKRESLAKDSPEYKELTTKITDVSKEVIAYQKNLVQTYPSTLVSKIVNMSMEVDIPDAPRNSDGSLKDSNFTYNYYRDHYFDNIDMKDDRLLNTPVFHNKF